MSIPSPDIWTRGRTAAMYETRPCSCTRHTSRHLDIMVPDQLLQLVYTVTQADLRSIVSPELHTPHIRRGKGKVLRGLKVP